jgi:hypothetical protein
LIDNSGLELDDSFLEGTSAIVLDATDPSGVPIYHPNVIMGIAPDFSLVELDVIQSPTRRARVVDRLTAQGRTVIDVDFDVDFDFDFGQVRDFTGNAIELHAPVAASPPSRAARPTASGRASRR